MAYNKEWLKEKSNIGDKTHFETNAVHAGVKPESVTGAAMTLFLQVQLLHTPPLEITRAMSIQELKNHCKALEESGRIRKWQ